jgi:hypothetical protein
MNESDTTYSKDFDKDDLHGISPYRATSQTKFTNIKCKLNPNSSESRQSRGTADLRISISAAAVYSNKYKNSKQRQQQSNFAITK